MYDKITKLKSGDYVYKDVVYTRRAINRMIKRGQCPFYYTYLGKDGLEYPRGHGDFVIKPYYRTC